MRKYLLAFLTLLGLAPVAFAQQAVQQQPSHLDAATLTQSTTAAVSTAVTVTLPAVAGKYHQITALNLELASDATGAACNAAWSTTNLGGLNGQIGIIAGVDAVALFPFYYPTGLLSNAPGTATTVVISTQCVHGAPIINVAYSAVAGVSGNQ